MPSWLFPKKGTGALPDPRTKEEKQSDYLFEELTASPAPVVWTEKTQWKQYPVADQNGSGSCVAQSLALMLGIHQHINNGEFVPFSATHIYQQRVNKPAAGMVSTDAFAIAQRGVTLAALTPSQRMTDVQMDTAFIEEYKKKVGEQFGIGKYVLSPIMDIETVASIIQTTGKPVMVWYRFNYDEWTDVPEARATHPALHHSVVAVDFTLYRGRKCLVIQDSWGQFGQWNGYRLVSDRFHNLRNTFVAHFMTFKYAEGAVKPTYDGSVVSLQNCLKHYGTFPTNVDSTGFLGGITWKAVRDFQVKEALHKTGVNSIGPLTTNRLNELYP